MEQVKKVIIVGSKGMAGHVVFNYLKQQTSYNIIDIARGDAFFCPAYDIDVTDFTSLKAVILAEKPYCVINCIGLLNEEAEKKPDKAILLNSYLPHFLAELGKQSSFRVIHISTDCVFSGKDGGYTEASLKDGIGFYAQSKALGEITYGNNLTLRTSIIGPELKTSGIGLLHWFMQQSGSIQGFSEAYWTGVTTIELAKAIHAAIEQNVIGLHHLVNDFKISKHDLLVLFKQIFDRTDILIEKNESYKVDKSLIKTNKDFNYDVPSYHTMIEEMKAWIDGHTLLYHSY